jgi:DNA/RNA-binding domain of Phe-tRNA-synthetase-like protein
VSDLRPGRSFCVAPEVFARLPGLQIVAVVARNIGASRREAIEGRWVAAWAGVHAGFLYPNAQSHPHIAQWRTAMRGIGAPHKEFPTSVESLVRRALKQPAPFRIHPLVDFYNAVSLAHVVPAGAFDLDALDGDVELRETRAGDTFHALDAESAAAVPSGEVAYTSGPRVLTRHLVWRQSRLALIGEATRNALLMSELLAGQEGLVPVVREALAAGAGELFGATVSVGLVTATEPELRL